MSRRRWASNFLIRRRATRQADAFTSGLSRLVDEVRALAEPVLPAPNVLAELRKLTAVHERVVRDGSVLTESA